MKEYTKNIKWVLVGLLMLGFTLIAFFLVADKIHALDNCIYGIVSKCINPTMTMIVKQITKLANPTTLVILVLIVCYILGIKQRDRNAVIAFVLNVGIITILNFTLKNIFVRIRPEDINIITETGYSFPSGHSALSMSLYGYIIYLINTRCNSKALKISSTVCLSLVILLVGISRIYLGVHFASDVIAAFMLSLSYLIVYIHVLRNIEGKNSNSKAYVNN